MNTVSEGRLPIVDGDEGADLYGYAADAAHAQNVCSEFFADEIAGAERRGPVRLRTGEVLPEAWVVITVPCAEAAA